jgi:hypothetical protein
MNGYDRVPEISRYDNVDARLCTERRKGLGTEYNPDHGSKTVFQEEVLCLYLLLLFRQYRQNLKEQQRQILLYIS